ncbi:MAG: PIN domain-containing protein [Chloroflexota bacterium]|nr:PIN domain-containing protein [Chloroflexota bacterium]
MRSNLFILDTSVWLEIFPARPGTPQFRDRVDALLSADLVATTGVGRLELLGGVRSQEEWTRLSELLSTLHNLPVVAEDWQRAASTACRLLREGITIPFTDLLIGEVAFRSETMLMHRDRHFDSLASHIPLQLENYISNK